MNEREPSPLFLDLSSPISDEFFQEHLLSNTIFNDTLNSIESSEIIMDDVNEVIPDKNLSRSVEMIALTSRRLRGNFFKSSAKGLLDQRSISQPNPVEFQNMLEAQQFDQVASQMLTLLRRHEHL